MPLNYLSHLSPSGPTCPGTLPETGIKQSQVNNLHGEDEIALLSLRRKSRTPAKVAVKEEEAGALDADEDKITKKVKKKDPIMFDLFQALKQVYEQTFQTLSVGRVKHFCSPTQPSKKQDKSSASKKTAPTLVVTRGGNALDSSAPSKRRGKERERPKVKRKTALKKSILAARETRKAVRNISFASNAVSYYYFPGTSGQGDSCELKPPRVSRHG